MDEAVVRIIMVDGAGGAARAGATSQSSTAGLSTSSQAAGMSGAGGDKLYREMSRGVVDTVKGFDKSIIPLGRKLDEVIELLTDSIQWDAKDYAQEEISTGKIVGAIWRGNKAIGDEIAKALGVTDPNNIQIDAQRKTNESNRGVIKAVTDLNKSLNPETIYKQHSRMGDILKTALLGLGLTKLAPLLSSIGEGLRPEPVIAAAGVAAPGAAAVSVSAAQVAGNTIMENLDIVIPLVIGGLAGLALNLLSPKDTKEKTTNELLAEISTNTDFLSDTSSDINTIALYNRAIDSKVGGILELMSSTGVDVVGDVEDMAGVDVVGGVQGDELVGPTEIEGPPEPSMDEVRAMHDKKVEARKKEENEIIEDFGLNLTNVTEGVVPPDYAAARHGGPDWPGDKSTIPPELDKEPLPEAKPYVPEQPIPLTSEQPPFFPDPDVENSKRKRGKNTDVARTYRAGDFLSDEQKQQLVDAGIFKSIDDVPKQIRKTELEIIKDKLPEGFASGGAVGTDTIPAMLSPGEVVVPKSMVDGGAVDHLKGKIPGFSVGGVAKAAWGAATSVRSAAIDFGTTASDDTGGSIKQIGAGIGAMGEKLSMAVPVIGGFVKGIGMAGEALGGMVSALNEVANRYGEYSPQIAQAQAVAEIQQTMGDMRRAQEVGGEMAKFVMAQSEMQQKFEEVKIKLLMQIVPMVTQMMEVLSTIMGSGEGVENAILALVSPLAALASFTGQATAAQRDAQIQEIEDPTAQLLNGAFDRLPPNPGGQHPLQAGWTPGF